MKLEKLNIAIRPRRDWEAVDLGILMARHWWSALFRTWLVVTLPFYLPLLFLPLNYLTWYWLFVWLCKPLYERPLLMILSQGVFGSTPSFNEVMKAAPKLFAKQWFLSVTWRRLSFSRSMDLPVVQLEGLKGQERKMRLDILHRQDSAPAKWLTVIGFHLEGFLELAIIAFVYMMIPESIGSSLFDLTFWSSKSNQLLWIISYYFAMACIAPFYVACGFSLYLNRRVKLEGWDLEIAFRRIVQRRGFSNLVFIGMVCLAVFTFFKPTPTLAQETTPPSYSGAEVSHSELQQRESVREEFIDIVGQPPFRNTQTVKTLKTQTQNQDEASHFWFESFGEFFQAFWKFIDALALYMELLLWVAVIGLIIFVVLRFKRWQTFFAERGWWQRDEFRPKTLFGLEVTEESLPEDISQAALQLWQQGEHRAALALLYRASLTRLLINGVPLKDGSTEQECLTIARSHAQEGQIPERVIQYFTDLTHHWRRLAYGHITPPENQAQQLCSIWNQYWLESASV